MLKVWIRAVRVENVFALRVVFRISVTKVTGLGKRVGVGLA